MSKTNKKKELIVFTDGSCASNGSKNAPGGIGIHFPNGELSDISKVFHLDYCTNQRTELYAILTSLRYINQQLGLSKYKVVIKTDSQYSIDCITKWVYGWIKNGWKTKNNKPVANKEMIETIHKYYEKFNIEFIHVDAHTGLDDEDSIANARADELATRATKKAIMEMKKNVPRTSKSRYDENKMIRTKSSKSIASTSFPKDTNFIVELVKSK